MQAINENARMLSYLPLSHVAERALVEHGQPGQGHARLLCRKPGDVHRRPAARAAHGVLFGAAAVGGSSSRASRPRCRPAKLDLLLKIPVLGGIVRRKVLTALGLQECEFAAGGAAPMPPDLLRWYNKLGLDLVEVYGMTENCGVSHAPRCLASSGRAPWACPTTASRADWTR